MQVLFATAELAPLTHVGGLGEAAAGLVRELRASGIEVELVLPDYSGFALTDETTRDIDVPAWSAPARARSGTAAGVGRVTLIESPGIAKPHPYTEPSGEGWPDNTQRFFGFSAAVAALAADLRPDILHLNDWHTAATLGMRTALPRSVLTIHNLAYQGIDASDWLARLPVSSEAYARANACNPLAGGIALADRVVAVSPTYAQEIVQPAGGCGLDALLRARGEALTGILNGIDATSWDPRTDAHLAVRYDIDHLDAKARARADLLASVGWSENGGPLVAIVTRLSQQKGIELALQALPALAAEGGRLVLLGSGEHGLAVLTREAEAAAPGVMRFIEDFAEGLAHRMFAGADLLLMPSRFEPCGLTQMQAMAYGTIPVVTPVGGLLDTVIDAAQPAGNGFLAAAVDGPSVIEALRRAIEAWRDPERRRALQERGMRQDWSWRGPARRYAALYQELARSA